MRLAMSRSDHSGKIFSPKSAVGEVNSSIFHYNADSLSVTIDPNSNASSFPSPGSSFLPPPMPQAHEFALPHPSKLPKKTKEPDTPRADSRPGLQGTSQPSLPTSETQVDL